VARRESYRDRLGIVEEMIMQDGTNNPAPVPVASGEPTGPAARRRTSLLLSTGGAVGLAVGILLSFGWYTTCTFFTQTLPGTRDSVQVFNELNELRQQINQMNEDKQLKDQEKAEAVRQALSSVASTARLPVSGMLGGVPPTKDQGGGPDRPPVEKARDPFADIDDEIANLEHTQKVLNTILDMFSPKGKERAKDR
jgi:hypothetical protein